jgi:hypothetical protein
LSEIPFVTDLSVVSSADVMTVGVPTVSITIYRPLTKRTVSLRSAVPPLPSWEPQKNVVPSIPKTVAGICL